MTFVLVSSLALKLDIAMHVVYLPFLSVFFQDIHTVLSDVLEGRAIVQSLDTDQLITIKQRHAMVRILVSHLIEKGGET